MELLFETTNPDEDEIMITGGMGVAEYFCKRQPKSDSKSYSVFNDLVVPIGLTYQPLCETYERMDEATDDESHCANFDKLFFLGAKDLGKSKNARKTRKKIPQ
jgi:hypothetical protein